jgi:tetratricopeptide (TPR) repeat protein
MAPEQAEGRPDRIDARTDVYGLGAVLYEVLTGRPPFAGPDTASVLRLVIHAAPARPRALVPDTPPALEAVCLKALAKGPAGRYATAGALADDVRRWLADEPVSAYREPFVARAARWARRHRPLVAGAAALLVAAVVGLTTGAVLLGQANARTHAEWKRAEDSLVQARAAEEAAGRARAQAEESSAMTQAIDSFLINDLLAAARPDEQGRDVTVKQAVDRAAARIPGAFADQPKVEGGVRLAVGNTYRALGFLPEAESHLRAAVDLHVREYGPEHPRTLHVLNERAVLLREQGKWADAATAYREALAAARVVLGEDHDDTRALEGNLAEVLNRLAQYPEAEALFRRWLESDRRTRGSRDPRTAMAMNGLGDVLMQQSQFAEAEPLLREALEVRREHQGPNHPETLATLNNLANVLQRQGKTAEALDAMTEVGNVCDKVFGPDHPRTLLVQFNRGAILYKLDRSPEAERVLRDVYRRRRRVLPAGNPETASAGAWLAMTLLDQGKAAEAEPLAREAAKVLRAALPANHPERMTALATAGWALTATGHAAEAEPLLRDALEARQRAHKPDDWRIAQVKSLLGDCLAARGRATEAEPLLLAGHAGLAAAAADAQTTMSPQYRRHAVTRLVHFYEAAGRPDEAAAWRAKLKPAGP